MTVIDSSRPCALRRGVVLGALLALSLSTAAPFLGQERDKKVEVERRAKVFLGEQGQVIEFETQGDGNVFTWRNGEVHALGDSPQPFVLQRLGFGRGFLGVEVIDLTDALRVHFGVPEGRGVMVAEVVDDSPAQLAGIAVGDIVTMLDSESIASSRVLARSVRALSADQEVQLEVWRDGAPLAFTAHAAERTRPLVMVDRLPAMGDDIRFHVELIESDDGEPVELHAGELLERLGKVVGDGDWQPHKRRLQGVDWEGVARRMEEVERQLRELEQRLQEVEPDR